MLGLGRKAVSELKDPGQVFLVDHPGSRGLLFFFQYLRKVYVGKLGILGEQQGFDTRIIFIYGRLIGPVQKMGVHFVTVIAGPIVVVEAA